MFWCVQCLSCICACTMPKNHRAALFCLSSALGVCGEANFHDIIFFLLVSLLENEISLGACKPNYRLIEGIRCVTVCVKRLGQCH